MNEQWKRNQIHIIRYLGIRKYYFRYSQTKDSLERKYEINYFLSDLLILL